MQPKKWFEKTGTIYWYDQYALNEAKTAFAKYDPKRIVRELLYANADIYAIYAANQNNIAYYPSKVIPKHPNLGKHDYVGEIIPQLRKKGKKVVLYVNWLDAKHPEWSGVYLQEDGTVADHRDDPPLVSWADPAKPEWKVRKRVSTPCVNSPKRELIKKMVQELAENYEFDGFHLDMFALPCACICEYCKPFLKEIFGKDDVRWEDIKNNWFNYLNWKIERHIYLLKEINAILNSRNITAWHNAFSPFAAPAGSGLSEKWLPYLDGYVSECFDVFESKYADMHSAGLVVKFHRAIRKPSIILLTSTPLQFYHAPVSSAKFSMYASIAKANGGHIFGPCGVGARQDTTTDKRLLKSIKDVFAFWKKDKDNFDTLESAAEAGLIYSFATRAYYEPARYPARYTGEITGWARVLIEKHIPFNLETAELLDDTIAERYKLLLLPNTACTDHRFEDVIRRFVERGGRIIASAETSLYDETGKKKKDFGLADVLGVSHSGPYKNNCFYVEDEIEPVICGGEVQCVKAKARIQARLIEPDPSGPVWGGNGLDPLPFKITDWPLLTTNSYKKGKVSYVAWEPGKFIMDHGLWQTVAWLREVIKADAGKLPFTTNAPSTVEITLWRDKLGPENRTTLAELPGRHSGIGGQAVAGLAEAGRAGSSHFAVSATWDRPTPPTTSAGADQALKSLCLKDKKRLIFKLANMTVPQAIPTRHTRSDIGEIIPLRDIELVLETNRKINASSQETEIRVLKGRKTTRIILKQLNAYASVAVEGNNI